MDSLYAGIGGVAMRRRVAATSVAAASDSTKIAQSLPAVKAIANTETTARFITFAEAGLKMPVTRSLDAPSVAASTATPVASRFVTFAEAGIQAPLSAPVAANSQDVAPRFATFDELGIKVPTQAPLSMTTSSSAHATSIAKSVVPSNVRFVTFAEAGIKAPTATPTSAPLGASEASLSADMPRFATFQQLAERNDLQREAFAGKGVHWKSTGSKKNDSDNDADSRGFGDMKQSPMRTKLTARRTGDAKKAASSSSSSSSALYNMATRQVIDARSVALAPPAAVTGDAYAVSIKGIKRAVKAVRGKVSSGGPAFVPFKKGDELGTQGLNDAQISMLEKVEASERQIVSDKPLAVLNDRATYEFIGPVGAKQTFKFRFAGKRLIPVTVQRAVHKYRIKEGKPLAGYKVLHVGGLGNVASKKKLLAKTKRKGPSKLAPTVYKGQAITLSFRNHLTGRESSVTIDNALEVVDANSYPGSASVWYAPLDASVGPAMLVMLFEKKGGLEARLSDLLFLYAPEVDLKANGASVQLLASERYLATQLGALIDEVVVSGYEASHATSADYAESDHENFSQVLGTLQSIVAAPADAAISTSASDQLRTYVGALAACVHAHNNAAAETDESLDNQSPVALVAGGDTCVVNTDEPAEAAAEFAHTLAEVASDIAALGLNAHAVTIRAGTLYENVFNNLQCGVHLAGHMRAEETRAAREDAMEAESHLESLAALTFAHIVGHIAVQNKMSTSVNTFWNVAESAATDTLNYEALVASHFA